MNGQAKAGAKKAGIIRNREYNSLQGREHLWKCDKILFLEGVCVCV